MNRIEVNPDICNGRAVIKGTRITVSTILEYLSAGDTINEITKGYPQLRKDDILACLKYAHYLSKNHSAVNIDA